MHKSLTAITLIGVYIFTSAFSWQNTSESIKRGKEVYELYCQSCHMEDGKGTLDINPPVAKTDYLKKPSNHLIEIILKGQSGEIVVNGKKYNTPMPAMEYLSDEQVADVINFIRNSWGNKIPGTVTPVMVKGIRKN